MQILYLTSSYLRCNGTAAVVCLSEGVNVGAWRCQSIQDQDRISQRQPDGDHLGVKKNQEALNIVLGGR